MPRRREQGVTLKVTLKERIALASQAAGGLFYGLVLVAVWIHAHTLQPAGRLLADGVLPVWEESCKVRDSTPNSGGCSCCVIGAPPRVGRCARPSPPPPPPLPPVCCHRHPATLSSPISLDIHLQAVIREWFTVLSRNLNSASAFLLSLLSGRSYRRTAARHAEAKQQAWHRWWRSARGTFNALLEQEGLAGEPSSQLADADHSPLPSPQLPRRSLDAASSGSSSSLGGGSGSSRRWRFWQRRASSVAPEDVPPTPTGASELRRGSVLFELPSGFGVSQVGPLQREGAAALHTDVRSSHRGLFPCLVLRHSAVPQGLGRPAWNPSVH